MPKMAIYAGLIPMRLHAGLAMICAAVVLLRLQGLVICQTMQYDTNGILAKLVGKLVVSTCLGAGT